MVIKFLPALLSASVVSCLDWSERNDQPFISQFAQPLPDTNQRHTSGRVSKLKRIVLGPPNGQTRLSLALPAHAHLRKLRYEPDQG